MNEKEFINFLIDKLIKKLAEESKDDKKEQNDVKNTIYNKHYNKHMFYKIKNNDAYKTPVRTLYSLQDYVTKGNKPNGITPKTLKNLADDVGVDYQVDYILK